MVLCASALLAVAPPAPLFGFSPASSAVERNDEMRLLDLPSAQGAIDDAQTIGAHPHYAGTPADYALATWSRDLLAQYGFQARLEPFTTVVDAPKQLVVEYFPDGRIPPHRPTRAKTYGVGLDLREVGTAVDPATLDPAIGLPFNAGSADGDVTAPLVYVNHALPADFETLAHAGVSVRGAIALIRYGAGFRGDLVRNAQEAGAVGALLYSDPADDGAGRGATYPSGPWRPSGSVQRGSLGDGIRIPVIPLSADNGRRLLATLRGPAGPAGWSGGLQSAYPLARGPGAVHMIVELERRTQTLWNTIGVLPGNSNETVVLGAHRDAWVYGVTDNGSGTITLLEAARALGNLAGGGRRPRRTIVIALWDGEEIGLRGSQHYVDVNRENLRGGCIAYLNADEMVTGPRIEADAVGALAPLVTDVSRAVADPAQQRQTLRVRWERQRGGITVEPPGGGSDHASFLNGAGTPVAEFAFSGPFGPYHSSYDTTRYAQTQSDPGFALHRAAAQVYGVLAWRLANADAIPYSFAAYVPALRSGLLQLDARAQRDGRSLDLVPIRRAIDAFAAAAQRRDDATAQGAGAAGALDAAQRLDALAYGQAGYAAVAFPELTAAYARGDAAALGAAVARATQAVERATQDL